MGFALCACLVGHNSFKISVSEKAFGFRARVIALGDMPQSHYASEIFFGPMTFDSSHIWILYVSRNDWFAIVRNGKCSKIEVVFETSIPGLNVEECGVSLVYRDDVETWPKPRKLRCYQNFKLPYKLLKLPPLIVYMTIKVYPPQIITSPSFEFCLF